MIKLSTGLAGSIAGQYGLARMMNRGVIDVYTGEQPANANQPPSGTLIARVSANGLAFVPGNRSGLAPVNGLELFDTGIGELRDNDAWVLKGSANGTAGWWRWKWALADNNQFDPSLPRMDGNVNESLILPSAAITPSTLIAVKFVLRLPT